MAKEIPQQRFATEVWRDAIVAVAESIGRERFQRQCESPTVVHAEALKRTYQQLLEFMTTGHHARDLAERRFAAVQASLPLTSRSLVESYERVLDMRPTLDGGEYRLVATLQQRKPAGSYFTPEPLIRLALEASLGPLLLERLARKTTGESTCVVPNLSEWTGQQREAAERMLLSLRICDPACGPGGFLLAAAHFLADRLALLRAAGKLPDALQCRAAWQDVVTHCLFGMDRDPISALVARFAFWLEGGLPAEPQQQVAPQLYVGDSLGLDDQIDHTHGASHSCPLIWLQSAPEVFSRCPLGFDLIVGNPPFANAIEGLVSPDTKLRLAIKYPEVTGAADLSYYFLALAHRMARPDGAVALVLPRGVLSGRSMRLLRERLLAERPPALVYAPQNQSLFAGADVFVVLLVLRAGGQCLGSRDRNIENPKLEPVRITSDNWWTPLVADTQAIRNNQRKVGDVFEVFASMTTGMAYDIQPFLLDRPRKGALKFVTTGLIDPGRCKWGRQSCRYLKRDFAHPFVHETSGMPAYLAARIQKVRRPKVLVAGLSARVEAFLDARGSYCGAVSTFTLLHPADDRVELDRLCETLNGGEATQCLYHELGAHSMSGGRITLNKEFLRRLPYP